MFDSGQPKQRRQNFRSPLKSDQRCLKTPKPTARPAHSGLILRSPGRVSKKREFSWFWPETFANFCPKKCERPSPKTFHNVKSRISRAFLVTKRIFSKSRNAWLGREGSNLRMAESKSAALPLGYAPSGPLGTAATRASADSLEWCRSIGSGAAFQPPGGAKYQRRRWRRAMPYMSATPPRSRWTLRRRPDS